MTLKSN